jgi:ATP-dependent exoDNAse (exonuclease V) alpha subunit
MKMMPDNKCIDCPIKDLQKIHTIIEKRVLRKLPEDVCEHISEAKQHMGKAFRGLIWHAIGEKGDINEQNNVKTQHIKFTDDLAN